MSSFYLHLFISSHLRFSISFEYLQYVLIMALPIIIIDALRPSWQSAVCILKRREKRARPRTVDLIVFPFYFCVIAVKV